jgi:hypothetical protein
MTKFWSYVIGVFGFIILLAVAIRLSCFGFVENYELGYQFDKVSGQTTLLTNKDNTLKNGYIYANPLVSIYTIDLRPMQVTINANNRVLNAKLVQFNPKGFRTFIAWHGNNDYEPFNLKDILMSYAYDPTGKNYEFLTILKELKNEDSDNQDTVDIKVNDSISK